MLVLILGSAVGQVLGDGLKEAGKDGYAALKNLILRKVGEWKASKEPVRRERIMFVLDDEHMLVNKADDKERTDL